MCSTEHPNKVKIVLNFQIHQILFVIMKDMDQNLAFDEVLNLKEVQIKKVILINVNQIF